jgi:hypothetical protein
LDRIASEAGSPDSFTNTFDLTDKGMNLKNGNLKDTGVNGVYWSATPIPGTNQVYCMVTREDDAVITVQNSMRAFGRGLRCVKK